MAFNPPSPTTLNGPEEPAVSGRPARHLVVLLHGVGANGDDLIDLAPYLASVLPEADFLSPHGPYPFDMAPFGRQWFSLAERSEAAMYAGAEAASPILNAFLDEQLASRGLADANLILLGFSQGAMMALHAGLRRPAACAAILAFSGMLVAPLRLPDEIVTRPPVLLVHGEEDEVVPFDFMEISERGLQQAGVAVQAVPCPGLGHSIDDHGLQAALGFLAGHVYGA